MIKKVISLLICLILVLIPACSATFTNNNIINQEPEKNIGMFSKVNIEANGKISVDDWFAIIRLPNMWKTFWFKFINNEDKAFVSFWRLIFQTDSEITISCESTGDILWEYQGESEIQLVIIGYTGVYISESINNDQLHVTLDGYSVLCKPKLI